MGVLFMPVDEGEVVFKFVGAELLCIVLFFEI
ncbi:hypothetical protein Q648_00829 [Bartonella quintana JK 12]|uniref:Uncharacterized protein n=2 Tax=Bartonella quintana TaxID=803 RepID=W3TY58_BARQI|nr:hypothetical protein Q651_01325 [Bartonella quintana BQ2-D70]ETS14599.1 hypothetical protein Q650_01241 [Bartonella quintana JK 73rel]ETS16286.1 hypothetical protein Q649_01250 [Bartonella quintana JK 73]ETS18290.1 hypothetical protein Q647_01240 [Bartonella quintana JK 7]ETS19119.1 hypothetical protein Q648_00829 [Bartonella quintana JK 12]KEC60280.1 hypothetical protein O93_00028 [Bartonella quintana JK 19]KEC60818.1 hypothetical protein O91_01000 [Bartonella quintana JK 31]KEC61463.1 h